MIFYKRFCGDYSRDTSGLTMEQHGAYTLLLDFAYGSESGIPVGYPELHRICRAMSLPEQQSVNVVADKFFPVGTDGFRHNARVDKDLPDAQHRIAVARANGKKHLPGKPPGNPVGKPAAKLARARINPPTPLPAAPAGVRVEVWESWLKYRGQQKAATIALQAKRLAAWAAEGKDANEIIERSIANGWKGLFPPDRLPPTRDRSKEWL